MLGADDALLLPVRPHRVPVCPHRVGIPAVGAFSLAIDEDKILEHPTFIVWTVTLAMFVWSALLAA